MSGLGGLWLVAKRELRERSRSKAFLIASAVTILLIVGVVVVPQLIGNRPAEYSIGLLGNGNQPVIETARALNAAAIAADPDAKVTTFEVTDLGDRNAAEAALRDGSVDVVLVDGKTLLQEQKGFSGSGIVNSLQQAAGAVRLQDLTEQNGEAAAAVVDILSNDPLELADLQGDNPATGDRTGIAYAGMVLMYIAILTYGNATLTGVTEEKGNRVVEVLLATLRPWQLLGGKVLGIGGLAAMQFSVTLVVAYAAIRLTGAVDLPVLDLGAVLVLILWFVLGFSVYSVLFGAVGSLTSRPEEAQTASFPLTMLAVVGFFVSFGVLDDANSLIARIATFVPFTAPFVVPIRTALNSISPSEHLLAVLAIVLSIAIFVRLAGRIYAGGLLRFAGRVKFKEAWRGE